MSSNTQRPDPATPAAESAAQSAQGSTLSDVDTIRHPRVAAWGRRAGTAVMLVAVLAAATGFLGVRSGQVSASGGGVVLTVDYAAIARPGLDVPLRIRVTSEDAFGAEITLAIDRDYLAMFETQGFHPEPSATTALDDDVLLTFDAPPDRGSFTVDYDAYVQPADQTGTDGRISVMSGTDRLATVRFHTALIP